MFRVLDEKRMISIAFSETSLGLERPTGCCGEGIGLDIVFAESQMSTHLTRDQQSLFAFGMLWESMAPDLFCKMGDATLTQIEGDVQVYSLWFNSRKNR